MSTHHSIRAVKALKIFCPVDGDTLDLLMTGQIPSIDSGGALAAILDVVRGYNPLGDFGIYKSVVELAPGWELFTPDVAARPTLGLAETVTVSPTAVLTIYIPDDATSDAVSRAIDAIIKAHPWEVPVIEINDTFLVIRT